MAVGSDVPEPIRGLYAERPDPLTSDEFNGSRLDTERWAYRTKQEDRWGIGPDYVAFKRDGTDRFVAIRGNWAERKGSGIVTKRESHFGFYSMRWRTDGILREKRTPWHPAVWLASNTFASGADYRTIKTRSNHIEIDFVEFWHQPVWHCQTIPWGEAFATKHHAKKTTKPFQKLRSERDDFPTRFSGWQTHGLEYAPDYLQLWQQMDRVWHTIGKRIPINDQPTSDKTLNASHAAPGNWILSNKEHFDNISASTLYRDGVDDSMFHFVDSSLDVDYFRYFPLQRCPE